MSSPRESGLYDGWVRHRRFFGVVHELQTAYFTAYVDLDELPSLFAGSWIRAIARFRRSDHLGDPNQPLADAVRELVAARTGSAPAGPVRLLTNLRYFGHCFNPVSFYYLFDEPGERVEAVVAEVTNTPWGERHAYALHDTAPGSTLVTGTFDKCLHVSPFMSMDHVYRARATTPGQTLSVQIENHRHDVKLFEATLNLTRVPLTRRQVARMTAAHPAASARVLALIYGHAVGLKLSGARYHRHPSSVPAG